jgi:hypothetical protein
MSRRGQETQQDRLHRHVQLLWRRSARRRSPRQQPLNPQVQRSPQQQTPMNRHRKWRVWRWNTPRGQQKEG